MRLLLDTSVLIDALRSRRERRELLAQLVRDGHSLATTALNIGEVYAGLRAEESRAAEVFLESLQCYELTCNSGRIAGSLKNTWARKGRTISIADAAIAAVALERECTLLTDNRKDFPMPEPKLYPL